MRHSLPIVTLLLASCATHPVATARIEPAAIARHVEVLASDAYQGRFPGTAGETKTVAYIVEQMKAAGLQPGNKGSWFQDVPLVEIAPSSEAQLTVHGGNGEAALEAGEDAILHNRHALPNAAINASPLVFAGYGIHAPDRGWDDFAGVDVRGKTVVLLSGAPDALKKEAELAATETKIAEAERRGAAGVLVILSPNLTDERWDALVDASRRIEQRLDRPASAGVTVVARMRSAPADRLLAAAGGDLDRMREEAARHDFRARPLDGKASVRLDGAVRRFASKNVVGVLPGSKRPDEHVLFLAHWDGFGRCAPQAADPICNGAVDNASGVGGLIELARAFATGKRPERSVLFLATTAEEASLLGARHYAEQPVVPLAQTVGGLGADTIAAGVPADVVVLGEGLSPGMDRIIADAARSQGRRMVAAPDMQSFFERSDHYPLAAAGVPVLIATSIFAPASRAQTDRFFAERYHKPSDEYSPSLRFDGAALDIDLAYRVGLRLANSRDWPGWEPGTPYAQARAKQRR